MKEIKLNDLMGLERLLLEIDIKYKFDLSFNDAYTLHMYLNNVGKITSYFFLIQDEFHKKYNDIDKLKDYHNKLMDDSLEFDYADIVAFIEKILKMYGDNDFKTLIDSIRFW